MGKPLSRLKVLTQKDKPKSGSKESKSLKNTPAHTSSQKASKLRESSPVPKQTAFKATKQPENAFPRYSFAFVFRKPNGKITRYIAAAFNSDLAEKQARNLAAFKQWEFIKVVKRQRLDWRSYSPKVGNWHERACREYEQKMEA